MKKIFENVLSILIIAIFVIGGGLLMTYYKIPTDCFHGKAHSYCAKNYDGYKTEFIFDNHSFQCRTDNGRTNMKSFSEEFNFFPSEIEECNNV